MEFHWCPNRYHGLFDYHERLENGQLRCTTCGHVWGSKSDDEEDEKEDV